MNLNDYFETIVSEHCEGPFRFTMSLTRAESDMSDLTQRTFYTAVEAQGFDGEAKPLMTMLELRPHL
jgi:hypothetical protein